MPNYLCSKVLTCPELDDSTDPQTLCLACPEPKTVLSLCIEPCDSTLVCSGCDCSLYARCVLAFRKWDGQAQRDTT